MLKEEKERKALNKVLNESLYSQHSRSVARSLEALTHRMVCLTSAAFYQTTLDKTS